MSLVNLPIDERTARAATQADDAAEARMFRRPSEWRIFWEAFSRDRLAVGAAIVIGLVCLASALAPVLSPYDPTVGEFFLSHENIRIPERGKTYSINEGNSIHWTDEVRRWNTWLKEEDKETGRPYGARYVGTLVADAHRTLLKGGIFAYPADKKSPGGKLRLLYEANPMSFLVEQAGGAATNGLQRIMEIQPSKLHERVAVFLGSREEVERVTSYHA